MEKIVLELGEETTLKATKTGDETARFHVTGGAAVGEVEEGSKTLKLVGAQLGRTVVSYGADLDATTSAEDKFSGRARATEQSHDRWDIEVVAKGKKTSEGESPFASSNVHEGLLPMSEVQEGPSEKTPYGMDQENKPVAPHPSMTAGADTSNVARATEDAEATGPTSPARTTTKAKRKTASKK
jgi:hypothetical protein